MERAYVEDETFEKIDFSANALPRGDYDHCIFISCNFSGADLSGIHFSACEFTGCNFSMANLAGTALKDVKFKDCKLLGLHFEYCNDFLFSIDIDTCLLNLSSFYKMKLKKTRFKNSSLQEADFSEADLSAADFHNCDLLKAVFSNTILEKGDFRTAYNYSIDPARNRIKKARFSMEGIAGLLDGYDIVIE